MGKQNKKIEIEQKMTPIPLESIPCMNSVNSFYLIPKFAYYLNYDGQEELRYEIEVLCPNLAKFIKDNLDFKFVKDSNLGSIFIYVYKDGYYQLVDENIFKGFISAYVPEYSVKMKDIDEVFRILLTYTDKYIDIQSLNSDEDYINFKNGLLNLNTMQIEPHTPDKMFTVQIPVDYKPLDECVYGSVFETYMDFLIDGDNIMKNVLLECMGLAISNTPGYVTKKCILMIGAKDCGKTQIKKLLTELIGIKYTSSMDLDKMNDSRFGTSELYNKRLVGSNDMQYTSVADMGIFKQLTGGDAVSIEFKGRGAFSYVFKGLIWFLANDYPMFSGKKGKEIYERFLIIPCKNVVPKEKQDPKLVEKMLKEKEYIVSLCVNHLLELRKRKYKFIESKAMKDGLANYELMNNSLLQFVSEYCDIDDDLLPNERLNFSSFKKNYQIWCRDAGIKPMKIGQEEIKYYLGDKYGTDIVKNSTYYLSNIIMNENFRNEYQIYGG